MGKMGQSGVVREDVDPQRREACSPAAVSTSLPPVVPPQAQTYFLALSASALSCSCGLACALGSQFGSCVEVSKNQHRAVLRGLLLEFY